MKRAEKTLTKEEWADVERRVGRGLFGSVELMIDGYRVTLERRLVGRDKLGIMTFVNGVFKAAWCSNTEPSEEARRFFRVRKITYTLRGKERKEFIRRFGKRHLQEMSYSYTYPDPTWHSVSAMRRHFESNNDSIEWAEGPQPTGLALQGKVESGP